MHTIKCKTIYIFCHGSNSFCLIALYLLFQEGKTWLNIADAQEKANHDVESVQESYNTALKCAKLAKHPKLQVCIKVLGLDTSGVFHKVQIPS